MAVTVKKIQNNPINSNSFVVYDKNVSNNCFVIDPGVKECHDLEEFMATEQLVLAFILLTHEHFDHCWGCNHLQSRYNIPIVCSQLCAEKVRDHKGNFSVFYKPEIAFDINGEIQVIEPGDDIILHGFKMDVISTPGHTDSSISVLIDRHMFTGDALIMGLKTVTKLPGGSKEKDRRTMEYFKSLRGRQILVHPGHLEEFYIDDFEFRK